MKYGGWSRCCWSLRAGQGCLATGHPLSARGVNLLGIDSHHGSPTEEPFCVHGSGLGRPCRSPKLEDMVVPATA